MNCVVIVIFNAFMLTLTMVKGHKMSKNICQYKIDGKNWIVTWKQICHAGGDMGYVYACDNIPIILYHKPSAYIMSCKYA